MNYSPHSLYVSTKLAIDSARSSARSGRKDEARDWLRYFNNAGVFKILKFHEPELQLLGVDSVDDIRDALAKLEDECHPQTRCDQSDDIKALRSQMDALAFGVNLLLNQKQKEKLCRKKTD